MTRKHPPDLERLRSLFGQFHQDLDIDLDLKKTHPDEVAAFVIQQSWDLVTPTRDELLAIADDIRWFVRRFTDDATLEDALYRELTCEYGPAGHMGVSTREWLLRIADFVAQAATTRK